MATDPLFETSRRLLRDWRGEDYVFGNGVLGQLGPMARAFGATALVVCGESRLKAVAHAVVASLAEAGVALAGGRLAPDAGPNAPREDVYRLESYILHHRPDCVVAVGGGSTIDACKAANLLASLGAATSPEIDAYFGTGLVSEALAATGTRLRPLVAVQTAASSGAHLTKYSNITDPVAGQKKLIVDEALIPSRALFDYGTTASMPLGVTIDGVLDAIAHCFEVFCGAAPAKYALAASLAETAIGLAVRFGPRVVKDPGDLEAREALGMATDLGGYAIMIGGTSGAHLTSFSLVDLAAHGTACGLMNPYYAVFFAPAIEGQLRTVGRVFKAQGYLSEDLESLSGRDLGLAVAQGMVGFSRALGAPTSLGELPGFSERHIERALAAAKDPQLGMKLRNMPVPLTAELVDSYMGPILSAAASGDFSLIKTMP